MVKVFTLLSVLFMSITAATSAQTATEPKSQPYVEIIKYSWDKERINWQGNPFSSSERGNDVRTRVNTERRQTTATPLQVRDRKEQQTADTKPPDPPRYIFNYKVSVLNSATKTIKELDWDYVFRDAATGEELGRREFTSLEKVRPGKRKELKVSVSAAPIRRISVYNLGKNERDGLAEEIVILRIVFDDNTVWRAP